MLYASSDVEQVTESHEKFLCEEGLKVAQTVNSFLALPVNDDFLPAYSLQSDFLQGWEKFEFVLAFQSHHQFLSSDLVSLK